MITSNPANITAIPGQAITISSNTINLYNRSAVSTNAFTQGALAKSRLLGDTGFHEATSTAIQINGSEATNVAVIIFLCSVKNSSTIYNLSTI